MFKALTGIASSLGIQKSDAVTGIVSGHRVLFVNEKGPGGLAGLVPFLDVILSIDSVPLDDGENSLASVIGSMVETRALLIVYNMKTKTLRKTYIVSTCCRCAKLCFVFICEAFHIIFPRSC